MTALALAHWVILAIYCVSPAHAETDSAAPQYVLNFPDCQRIGDSAFSADGATLLMTVANPAVNVWALLVYYWPELLGMLCALVCVGSCMALIRAARRAELPGLVYCRHCHYCLEGASSDKCPECGQLRAGRQIIGRSFRRRAVVPSVVLVLAIGICATLYVAKLPRTGSVSRWFNWPSVALQRWGESLDVQSLEFVESFVGGIARINVSNGTIVDYMDMMSQTVGDLVAGYVGEEPAVCIWRGDNSVRVLSSRSGVLLRRLSPEHMLQQDRGEVKTVLGFSREKQCLYYASLIRQPQMAQVRCWHLDTGDDGVVFQTYAIVDPDPRSDLLIPQMFYSASLGTLFECRDAPGACSTVVIVRELSRGGSVTNVVSLPTDVDPCFEPGGRFAFIVAEGHAAIEKWDLERDELVATLGQLDGAGVEYAPNAPVLDSRRGMVFAVAWEKSDPVVSRKRQIAAIQERSGDIVSWLSCPQGMIPFELSVAPGGQTLGVLCVSRGGRYGIWPTVLLYDLSSLADG